MPPPSWANSATNDAPKPKPTIVNGAWSGCAKPPYATNMTNTPMSERPTTRIPETAPPRREISRASPTLSCAASAAVRLPGRLPEGRLHRHEQPDDARGHRAGGADEERDARLDRELGGCG